MRLLLALPFILASCSGGSSPPPAPSAPSPPTNWTLWFSPGAKLGAGPSFNFPTWNSSCPGPTGFNQTCPAVHYLVTKAALKTGLSMDITITGNAPVWNAQNIESDGNSTACQVPPSVRFFIQERGDDWSGNGGYAYYRWWSSASIPLSLGTANLSVPFDPAQWSSVNGEYGANSPAATAGFNQAIANASAMGMTFGGGCFYGHGVDLLSGSATFTLNSFQ